MIAAIAFTLTDAAWLIGGTLALYISLRASIAIERKQEPRVKRVPPRHPNRVKRGF